MAGIIIPRTGNRPGIFQKAGAKCDVGFILVKREKENAECSIGKCNKKGSGFVS